jgi:hypothetical protein
MLILKGPSQLNSITGSDSLKLANLRLAQLNSILHNQMIIVEPGNTVDNIEKEIGFPILINFFDNIRFPCPDFDCKALDDHNGCYEMVFILADGVDAVETFITKTGITTQLFG